MATPQKSTSFEVELTATSVSTPDRILKKLKAAEERRDMRRSISREELVAKLDNAAERKKNFETTRHVRAAQHAAKAKEVVSRKRQASEQAVTETKEKLMTKIMSAAEKKVEQARLRRQKLEEHMELVKARKDGAHDYKSEMTQKDIEEHLLAAEHRRKAMEEAQKEKLAEYHRRISQAKEAVASPKKPVAALELKLQAAELRRKEMENSLMEKLHAKDAHAKEVRKRKSLAVAANV